MKDYCIDDAISRLMDPDDDYEYSEFYRDHRNSRAADSEALEVVCDYLVTKADSMVALQNRLAKASERIALLEDREIRVRGCLVAARSALPDGPTRALVSALLVSATS